MDILDERRLGEQEKKELSKLFGVGLKRASREFTIELIPRHTKPKRSKH